MCFILVLAFIVPLVPAFRGPQPHFTTAQLLSHVAYLNSIVGKQWINPVYWSLGIEFQYYLLVGLIFPLLAASSGTVAMLTMGALLVPGLFVPQLSLLFVHLPLFVMGSLTYRFKVGRISKWWFLVTLGATCIVTGFSLGPLIAIIGPITSLVIAFISIRARILGRLGMISYSLYLMHVPVGGKIIDLGVRFRHGQLVPALFLVAATAASIVAAWILYRMVELPSQRKSSRISYRHQGATEVENSVPCTAAA
jgi:peptidoglycan/LPS O-acetylase OafA/YrhL